MKKLISVVLVLAMLASMMVYLPLGASAEESAATETIYSEDFTGKDGTYTLAELATKLGWTLLRGDAAATATIENGVLTIDTKASTKDALFLLATDAKLKSSHTIQYDMTQNSFFDGNLKDNAGKDRASKLYCSTIFVGTYNPETQVTKAYVSKTNNEGYNHIGVINGNWDEESIYGSCWLFSGTGHGQARPETITWGGGLSKPTTKTTWKMVFDVETNGVESYASGTIVNSTNAEKDYAKYNLADFLGENAYLKVQQGRNTSFDNISLVTGGDVKERVTSGVVFEQNFNNVTYDPATESVAALANKIGFWKLNQSTNGKDPTDTTATGLKTTYSIVDGKLDVLNPWGATAQDMLYMYIPELNYADHAVVEYKLQYVNQDILGEYDGGDQGTEMVFYGRNGSNRFFWTATQKGFTRLRWYAQSNNPTNGTAGNNRPQYVNYNNRVSGYAYKDQGGSHYNIYNSWDSYKIVMDRETGIDVYVNGQIAATSAHSDFATASVKYFSDLIGMFIKFYTPGGCHFQVDDIKVTVNQPEEAPKLLITEAASTPSNYDNVHEYIEVYNNSTEPVNIYDYALVNEYMSTYFAHGEVQAANIEFMYPGNHTFNAVNGKYSITHSNPSYEEGWIQPGEVAMLWSTANAMHNGGYTNASDLGFDWNTKYNFDTFRAINGVPENVKVFKVYNDYNRAMNNSGQMVLGLIDRSIVQPDYDPATGTGDEAIATFKYDYSLMESYALYFQSGGWNKYTNNENFTHDAATIGTDPATLNPFNDAATPATLLAQQFEYGKENARTEGWVINNANVTTRFDQTPGVVVDSQKRVFTVTVNGKGYTAYLGEAINVADYIALEGFQQALFVKVDGKIVSGSEKVTVKGDVTVEIGDIVALSTAPGASLRINYNESGDVIFGMRWLTAINTADLEALIAKYGKENVEIGTLIARTEELTDAEQALAIENLFDEDTAYDKVVRKAVAYAGEWYPATSDYEGFAIFAGGVGKMQLDYNAMKEYVAVGYVSVTIDGETYTLYGAADTTAQTKVIYDMMGEALGDYEENDAAGTPENSILTAEEYELVNEAYWNI